MAVAQLDGVAPGSVFDSVLNAIRQQEGNNNYGVTGLSSSVSPVIGRQAATQSLTQLLQQYAGNLYQAVAAYNAGPTGLANNPTVTADAQGNPYGYGYANAVFALAGLTPPASGAGGSATGTSVSGGSCADSCKGQFPAWYQTPQYLGCIAICAIPGAPPALTQSPSTESPATQVGQTGFCSIPTIGAPICATVKNLETRTIWFFVAVVVGLLGLWYLLRDPAQTIIREVGRARNIAAIAGA